MTVAQDWPLQQAIYATVTAAVPDIPVFDHVPTDPPEEFIRLDAFHLEDESPKNGERSRHSFMVHHFLRPTLSASTRGMARGKQVIATVHTALMATQPLGGRLDHENMGASPDPDGATAHVWSRYSVIL
jgi:hypothetical protein